MDDGGVGERDGKEKLSFGIAKWILEGTGIFRGDQLFIW
jgi:hypothetical protein